MADKETVEVKGVEIFATGTWHGDIYTTTDLDNIVNSFNDKGFEAPVKIGHNNEQEKDGQPAFGWIGRVFREGEKLLADLTDVPRRLGEAIKNKQYRQVSSEIIWNFKEGMPRVLRAVALLGADIPEVKGLAPLDKAELAFSDDIDCRVYEMPIGKKKKELEEDEEGKAKKKDIDKLEDEDEELEIKKTKQKEKKMSDEKVKALEEEVVVFKDSAEAETKRADEAEAELKKLSETARADKIKAFMSKVTDEGKVIPAFEKDVETLLVSLSDAKTVSFSDGDKTVECSQYELLTGIIGKMPNILEFAELAGDGEGQGIDRHDYTDQDSAGVELDRRIKVYMDKHDDIKYDAAMDKVLAADATLKKAYIGE